MKNYFFLFCFIQLQISFAQHNFNTDNSTLVWQKVINDTTSITAKSATLKQLGFSTEVQNNTIIISKPYSLEELEPHGYKWSGFPTYMFPGEFSGIVEFKDSKFRVTITSIQLNNITFNTKLQLSEYVLKKGEINQKKHHLKVLNTFNSYFTALFTKSPDNDW